MDRKRFMRDVYAGYWLRARDAKYGFMAYDKRLCELIEQRTPPGGTLLEVAIGTGYPVADHLAGRGYRVHGVDISPALVARCRERNPAIEAVVGDAERLEYPDGRFDASYCFHSSWYFPDLGRVIDEMVRVTRPGGLVLFDIQNRANPQIAAAFERRVAQVRPGLKPRLALHARNAAKVLLRRGNPNWHAVVYEVPTEPGAVFGHLRRSGAADFFVLARDESDQSLRPLPGAGDFPEYPRLVFGLKR